MNPDHACQRLTRGNCHVCDERDAKLTAALAHFNEYFTRNYPPRTIISDPAWHAPKVFRAAKYALEHAKLNVAEEPNKSVVKNFFMTEFDGTEPILSDSRSADTQDRLRVGCDTHEAVAEVRTPTPDEDGVLQVVYAKRELAPGTKLYASPPLSSGEQEVLRRTLRQSAKAIDAPTRAEIEAQVLEECRKAVAALIEIEPGTPSNYACGRNQGLIRAEQTIAGLIHGHAIATKRKKPGTDHGSAS